LQNLEEIYELGYEEYFYSDNYVFVEWPEKIQAIIPDDFHHITIEVMDDNSRLFFYN